LKSFIVGKLIKLRGKIVLFEVVTSFALFDLLMDLVFHLVYGIVIIRDLEWLAINFENFEFLINRTVSIIDLSNKFLELLRGLKFDIKVFSVQSRDADRSADIFWLIGLDNILLSLIFFLFSRIVLLVDIFVL
jgi:hypothetical protein